MMRDVRCCCDPSLIHGQIAEAEGRAAGLNLRELEDKALAFDSDHRSTSELQAIPGFRVAERRGTKKTWRKR